MAYTHRHSVSSSFADEYYLHADQRSLSPVSARADEQEEEEEEEDDDDGYGYYATAPRQSTTTPPRAPRKQDALAQINAPSFHAFASSIPVPSPTTATRHPIPPQSLAKSPRARSFSLAQPSPRFAEPGSRPLSLDSPLPKQLGGQESVVSPPPSSTGRSSQIQGQQRSSSTHHRHTSADHPISPPDALTIARRRSSSIPVLAKYAHGRTLSHAPKQSISSLASSADPYNPSAAHAPKQSVSSLASSADPYNPSASHLPKQSISSLASSADPYNPSASPARGRLQHQQPSMHAPQAPSMTLELDGVRRTLSEDSVGSLQDPAQPPKSPGRFGGFFGWKSSSQKSGTDSPTTTFSDRSLSPLPSPIVRKMDGQRLAPHGLDIQKANARMSVYFDNPDTPILLGSPETNAHVRELERELAQVSAELAGSIRREMDLEDEVDRLRAEMPAAASDASGRRSSDYFSDSGTSSVRFPIGNVDERIEGLEAKLRRVEQEKAQVKVEVAGTLQAELARRRDLEQMVATLEEKLHNTLDAQEVAHRAQERVAELEASLEEWKRKLSQERQAKDSVEDVFRATKDEATRLRTQVEELEAEKTRMGHELESLRVGTPRFSSIAEEGDESWSARPGGLSRSNSLARSGTRAARGGSLTRSGSVKEGGRQRSGSITGYSGPVSSEVVKEIEDQRDALHKALQLLIKRYEKQQRDHVKAVKQLTSARDRAEQASPKRAGYHREVAFLKEEVTALRKRAEDALEAKWQYEKGLGGLKMDLDRAEQETRGLRALLDGGHDAVVPGRQSVISGYDSDYGDDGGDDDDDDNAPPSAVETLHLTISTAELLRDEARQAAEAYRAQAPGCSDPQQLLRSAQSMEELAAQVDEHVRAHVLLRDRLAQAVQRGETEQRQSTRQIEEMQKRLAGMENSVLAAQQHSETLLSNHETEVRRLEEASSPALQRLGIAIPDPRKLSPPAASPLLHKSPKSGGKKMAETSLLEAGKTQMLERKVRELEGLLREAEDDVQEVVGRINRSQFAVAELQMERDGALREVRRLRGEVEAERRRAEALLV